MTSHQLLSHGMAWNKTLLMLVLAFLVGCRSEHDEEHDEESHFPPHWPNTFLNAADRLDQILNNPRETPTLASSIEQELTDLVDWLPELLADAEISKEDFDSIDAWAFPTAVEYKRLISRGIKIEELVQKAELRQGLVTLRKLADETKQRLAEERAKEEQEAAEARRLKDDAFLPNSSNPGVN